MLNAGGGGGGGTGGGDGGGGDRLTVSGMPLHAEATTRSNARVKRFTLREERTFHTVGKPQGLMPTRMG